MCQGNHVISWSMQWRPRLVEALKTLNAGTSTNQPVRVDMHRGNIASATMDETLSVKVLLLCLNFNIFLLCFNVLHLSSTNIL